jgi:hypothetical protein
MASLATAAPLCEPWFAAVLASFGVFSLSCTPCETCLRLLCYSQYVELILDIAVSNQTSLSRVVQYQDPLQDVQRWPQAGQQSSRCSFSVCGTVLGDESMKFHICMMNYKEIDQVMVSRLTSANNNAQ